VVIRAPRFCSVTIVAPKATRATIGIAKQAFAGQSTLAMKVREVEILLQLTVFRDLPPQ
jgi:hypothetical protein